MEISRRDEFVLITLAALALFLSTLLLVNPRLGRALVMRPLKVQPGSNGLAQISTPPGATQKGSNWAQAGSSASLNLSLN